MKVDGTSVGTLTDLVTELIVQTIKEKNLGLTSFEQESLIDGVASKLSRVSHIEEVPYTAKRMEVGIAPLVSNYQTTGR